MSTRAPVSGPDPAALARTKCPPYCGTASQATAGCLRATVLPESINATMTESNSRLTPNVIAALFGVVLVLGCDHAGSSFTEDYGVLYAVSKAGEPREFQERIAAARNSGFDENLQNFFAVSWLEHPEEFLERMALAEQIGLDDESQRYFAASALSSASEFVERMARAKQAGLDEELQRCFGASVLDEPTEFRFFGGICG